MTAPRLLQPLIGFVERCRPAFFSLWEWWFFLLLFVPLFPIGSYLFMGVRYFQELKTFLVGTPIGIFIYWLSMATYVLSGRWVIRRFPGQQQAGQRIAVMVLVFGTIAAFLGIFDTWVYSLFPSTGVRLSLETLIPLWLFGGVFVVVVGLTMGLFHIYSQWQDRQTENEELKREVLQQQYDTLRKQVNPHFLFNSLSSISALIGEDNARAEHVVDNLAKVYRYMLQADNRQVVPLADELTFIHTYTDLLRLRYGNSIQFELPPAPTDSPTVLPPLSLQTLIDNAVKHNVMKPDSPLVIQLTLVEGPGIRVTNTLQRKTRMLDTTPHGLAILMAKYRQLSTQPVVVHTDDTLFSVTLPLLTMAVDSHPSR